MGDPTKQRIDGERICPCPLCNLTLDEHTPDARPADATMGDPSQHEISQARAGRLSCLANAATMLRHRLIELTDEERLEVSEWIHGECGLAPPPDAETLDQILMAVGAS